MKLVETSVKRPVTISMVILAIIFIGFLSLRKLPISLFPKLGKPIITIHTKYEGASPEDIENLVTLPLEMQLSSISGLSKIESVSREGTSDINLIFNWDADIDKSISDVRQRIDLIKFQMPEDIEAPVIEKFDPNQEPVMIINISSSLSPDYLRNYAKNTLKPLLDRIMGVAAVQLKGGLDREIRVVVDIDKLSNLGLTFDQVKQKITAENVESPGGRVETGKRELLVRTIGKINTAQDVANILVSFQNNQPVYIKDIAHVVDAHKEKREFSRLNGQMSLSMEIYKSNEGNSIKISQRVKQALSEHTFPANMTYAVAYDQSTYINESLSFVKGNAIAGAFLAALVLLLFLRNFRSAFIISLSMPISIVCSFAPFYFSGMTFNIFSIAGIALGVGLVVDNSIVILENISRYIREGHSVISSAIEATKEVEGAVLASTLTTLAVFVPIIFVTGIAGKIFKDLSLTVIYVLSFSEIVAITIIPMLGSKLLKKGPVGKITQIKKKKTFLDRFAALGLDKYLTLLNRITRNKRFRLAFIVLILALFVVTLFYIPATELIPAGKQKEYTVTFSAPLGVSINRANEIMGRIEGILIQSDGIETVSSSLSDESGINEGNVVFILKQADNSRDVIGRVKSSLTDAVPAGYTVSVRPISIFENIIADTSDKKLSGDVVIKLVGTNLEHLEESADNMQRYLQSHEEMGEVRNSKSKRKPQIIIDIDKPASATLGLTTYDIASRIRTNLAGDVTTDIKKRGDQVDITVIGNKSRYTSVDDIAHIPFVVRSETGVISIPLKHFARVTKVAKPIEIRHLERQRIVGVSADISSTSSLGKVTQQLGLEQDAQAVLRKKMAVPDDVFILLSGSAKTLLESLGQLSSAFFMALALVYMIMAAQFESLLQPFIVMFAIPLSLIGAFFGLNLFGAPLSVVAFIGLIMMLGIVVNDSILLVSYINILRLRGIDRGEAIMTAGKHRIRPILMTTFTSILGMLPLALGIGSGTEFYASMSLVIIFGLLFSTILTLAFIPAVYILFDDLAEAVKLHIFRLKNIVQRI